MRKGYLKKIVALGCSVAMVATMFTGCFTTKKVVKKGGSGSDTLNIMVFAKGYGSDWLTALTEAFKAKYDCEVQIQLVSSDETLKSDIKNGSMSDTDLYFTVNDIGGHAFMSETARAYENGQALRDLTEVMNTKIPGEDKTIAEKMNQSLLYSYRVDGRDTENTADDTYYFMPYVASGMGLYYNETVIDNALGKGNWEVPNTSEELKALCKKLSDKGCSILIPGALDQWTASVWNPWWAQYTGLENYRKFYEGIGYNKSTGKEEENSEKIFNQTGRLAALEESYNILNNKTGFAIKNSIEINTNNLNEYQTRFTLAKNKLAFYPCGDWLMQELENNSTIDADSVIKMMKTPVISSIIDSTNEYTKENKKNLPNIKNDEVLSKVVDYVDGNGELPSGVTEEEVEYVRQARNMVGGKFMEHFVYAPVFSDAKELANNFLLFMASDEGIKVFKENCAGGFSPFAYDKYENLTETEQSVYEVTKEAIFVGDFKYNDLFSKGGVRGATTGTSDSIDGLLSKPKGMTAQEIFDQMKETYSGNAWKGYLQKLSYMSE